MDEPRLDRMPADVRYHRDPVFHSLVDVLYLHILEAQYTPTELSEDLSSAPTRTCWRICSLSIRPFMPRRRRSSGRFIGETISATHRNSGGSALTK